MRTRFAVCVLTSLFLGCSHAPNPGPALAIVPGSSGAIEISGPTRFSAIADNTRAEVRWSLGDGAGTLSSTSGYQVVYTPPPGRTQVTLIAATDDGVSAAVQITSQPNSLTSAAIPGLHAEVTVNYDAMDIPHIQCATKLDCFAVQGYIHARDRLFQMDFLRHVARAHLAELIGIDGLSQDVQLRTLLTARNGHRLEDDLVAALDPDTAAVVSAYGTGVNAFLAELHKHPEILPGEYGQLPFAITANEIADWSAHDTVAIVRLQQFQLSESLSAELDNAQFAAVYGSGPLADVGKMTAWIRAAAPSTEQTHTLSALEPQPMGRSAKAAAASSSPSAPLSAWRQAIAQSALQLQGMRNALRPVDASVGSNNWVVAASKSATGAAMVANDPHLALQYPPLFHLSAMKSAVAADHLDVTGGAFPGIPGVLVGRGAHVGWGVTVVGYDVTDLYLEQFLPPASCPVAAIPCVRFRGAPVATIAVPQMFQVRTAAGLVDAQTLGLGASVPSAVVIVPHHGPVIRAPDGSGRAVSVRWVGHEANSSDLKGILALNSAVDVDAAIAGLADYIVGAQNFVLADDRGHIAYDPHAWVPVRRFADIRLTDHPMPPWFPLPGDGSAEWGDGTANCATATPTPVPRSCWIAEAQLPFGKDPAQGFFVTANADPTFPSVSDDNNPLAHPPYLSYDWDDSTGFRATRITERLNHAIAAGPVSVAEMESIQSDHVSRPGIVFTNYIANLPSSASDPPELANARAVLADWATHGWDCPSGLTGADPATSAVDRTPATVANSAGCLLFHGFIRALFTRVFRDDLQVAGQEVTQLRAMKAMIYMLSLDPASPNYAANTSFCNDVGARGELAAAHSCREQVQAALVAAYSAIAARFGPPAEWVWGRTHTLTPVSPLPLVTTDYQPGPYARPGGAFTVDVGAPSTSAAGVDFSYGFGANVRHISVMDPGKPMTEFQLPGPERDGPAWFTAPDLLGQWAVNHYVDVAIGDRIEAVTTTTQSFHAN